MAYLGRPGATAPLTSADIPDNSITGAKIVDDAIDSEHYTAGSVDAAHVAADVATQAELDGLVDSAPGALNTLNELAAALNDDAAFSTTVTNSIAAKVAKSGDTMTGTLTVGVDDTGYDVKFFGATTGKYCLWDESADKLVVSGIIETTDLILNNTESMANEVDGTSGHWCVQEGDSDLFIINRVTNKKYKFKLEEIA